MSELAAVAECSAHAARQGGDATSVSTGPRANPFRQFIDDRGQRLVRFALQHFIVRHRKMQHLLELRYYSRKKNHTAHDRPERGVFPGLLLGIQERFSPGVRARMEKAVALLGSYAEAQRCCIKPLARRRRSPSETNKPRIRPHQAVSDLNALVLIWDQASGKFQRQLEGHGAYVRMGRTQNSGENSVAVVGLLTD